VSAANPPISSILYDRIAATVGVENVAPAIVQLLQAYVENIGHDTPAIAPSGERTVHLDLPSSLHMRLVELSNEHAHLRNPIFYSSFTDEVNDGLRWAIEHGLLTHEPMKRYGLAD
jgi:hypothetical protein